MKITELKALMKEINEPNEFVLERADITNPKYWIYVAKGVRLKTLKFELPSVRSKDARYDVFINGLFISTKDYIVQQIDNDFYIKFIRNNFPPFDRFGNVYEIEDTDEVKIKGDLEKI
jgi:hypothetical protein